MVLFRNARQNAEQVLIMATDGQFGNYFDVVSGLRTDMGEQGVTIFSIGVYATPTPHPLPCLPISLPKLIHIFLSNFIRIF